MRMYLTVLMLIICMMLSVPAYAGVNYTVYTAGGATPCFGCGSVIATGTSTNINYNWGGGYVMGTNRYDGVEIHFTGYITVPGSGSQTITFYDYSDDGFILNVNGSRVISNWQEQGPGYWNGAGSIVLQGGQTYAFDVWWYENGGGAAVAMYWNQSGSITLIPDASYLTTMPVDPKKFGDGGTSLPATSITSAQQTKINQTLTTHNLVYIDQSAGNNTYVKVTQTGDYNIVKATITGSNQSLTTTQTGNHNYEESVVSGSFNTMNNTQLGDSKSLFQTISGSNNNITTSQSGGNHFLDLNIPTNGNTVSVTQSGVAQKQFSLTINSPNVGVTVQQTNNTTPDSAAMTITCNTGSCNGYTYTKN